MRAPAPVLVSAGLGPGGRRLPKTEVARASSADAHLGEAFVRPQVPLPRNGSYLGGAEAGRSYCRSKGSGDGRRESDALPCAPGSELQVPGVSQTLCKLQQWV